MNFDSASVLLYFLIISIFRHKLSSGIASYFGLQVSLWSTMALLRSVVKNMGNYRCARIRAWSTTCVGDNTEVLRNFPQILIGFCRLLAEFETPELSWEKGTYIPTRGLLAKHHLGWHPIRSHTLASGTPKHVFIWNSRGHTKRLRCARASLYNNRIREQRSVLRGIALGRRIFLLGRICGLYPYGLTFLQHLVWELTTMALCLAWWWWYQVFCKLVVTAWCEGFPLGLHDYSSL